MKRSFPPPAREALRVLVGAHDGRGSRLHAQPGRQARRARADRIHDRPGRSDADDGQAGHARLHDRDRHRRRLLSERPDGRRRGRRHARRGCPARRSVPARERDHEQLVHLRRRRAWTRTIGTLELRPVRQRHGCHRRVRPPARHRAARSGRRPRLDGRRDDVGHRAARRRRPAQADYSATGDAARARLQPLRSASSATSAATAPACSRRRSRSSRRARPSRSACRPTRCRAKDGTTPFAGSGLLLGGTLVFTMAPFAAVAAARLTRWRWTRTP